MKKHDSKRYVLSCVRTTLLSVILCIPVALSGFLLFAPSASALSWCDVTITQEGENLNSQGSYISFRVNADASYDKFIVYAPPSVQFTYAYSPLAGSTFASTYTYGGNANLSGFTADASHVNVFNFFAIANQFSSVQFSAVLTGSSGTNVSCSVGGDVNFVATDGITQRDVDMVGFGLALLFGIWAAWQFRFRGVDA